MSMSLSREKEEANSDEITGKSWTCRFCRTQTLPILRDRFSSSPRSSGYLRDPTTTNHTDSSNDLIIDTGKLPS